jgi:predicted AAA+ superfamily ATPase
MKIFPRDAVQTVHRYLKGDEVILLTGARQSGKTTILRAIQGDLAAKSNRVFYFTLEDPDYLGLLNQSPKNLFQIFPIDSKSVNFVLIDEIQYLKDPSNFLKFFYDLYRDTIKIIATGSSAFYLDKKFRDSLVGRRVIIPVRTLSFKEFLLFKGEDGLATLLPQDFSDKNYQLAGKIRLCEKERLRTLYAEFLTYGGYPRVVLSPLQDKIIILEDIAYSYIKKDIFEANIRQDEVFYRLFKLLASQIGKLVNTNELSNTLGMSRKAVLNYLYVMQKSFHILLLRPSYKNVRRELTKMPKIYFYDLGLRNFLVNTRIPDSGI